MKSCSKRFGFGTKEEANEDRRQETVYLLRKRTDFGPEAVVLKSSVKMVFFEVLQNSQENVYQSLFLTKHFRWLVRCPAVK